MKKQKMKNTNTKIYSGLFLLGVAGLFRKPTARMRRRSVPVARLAKAGLADQPDTGRQGKLRCNLFLVSGNGLAPQWSWVTTVSPKIGFNFAPLLGDQKSLQTLSLSYTPDFNVYENAPSQSYDAHKIGDTIKGQVGAISFSLDNAFLYNDGNHQAPIYALNQISGAGANRDQFRNHFAYVAPRERLAQTQDRATVLLQYDWDKLFVRPTASLLDYNLMTDWHNTGLRPGKGIKTLWIVTM